VSVKKMLHNLPLPPGQVVGMIASVVLDTYRTARLPGPRMAHRVAGAMLMATGCAFTSLAVAERRRREDEEFDLERPQTLVTTGPYAVSRHPMYVGWWLIHLGFGVSRGSAWVMATVPLAILLEHRAVLSEERQLAQSFGQRFERYAERVPRYLSLASARTVTVHGSAVDPK